MKKLLFLLLFLISCNNVKEGNIVNKRFVPAHTYKYTTVIMCGKVPISQVHTGHSPDEWYITIYSTNYNKCKEFSVSQSEYNRYNYGDYIVFGEGD